jgi:hypothetical protein
MRNGKKWLIIIIILLVAALILNLCGITDVLRQNFWPDEEEKEEVEEEEIEEEEEPEACFAPFTLTIKPNGDKQWDATNQADLTRLLYEQRLQGWVWYAIWGDSVHQVSWISDEYMNKFDLLSELRSHYNADEMRTGQFNWYDCMITEKL